MEEITFDLARILIDENEIKRRVAEIDLEILKGIPKQIASISLVF